MRSFNRNLKAISPIFATLILIAIAVIAGVVVYMFTSGTLASMTSGGTAGQEKVAVQGVTLSATSGVTVYAQATNNMQVVINAVVIKNGAGDVVAQVAPASAAAGTLAADGTVKTIGPISVTGLTAGTPYSVTLISTKGGSFVSSSVICG
jgi:flagellin-like protein